MANKLPIDGLIVRVSGQNKWFWLFIVNGVIAIWSMRYFSCREACLTDAANKHLIL